MPSERAFSGSCMFVPWERPARRGGISAMVSTRVRSARISFHIATAIAVTSFSSAASTGP